MLLNIEEEENGIEASPLTFSEEITTDELKIAVSHLENFSTEQLCRRCTLLENVIECAKINSVIQN